MKKINTLMSILNFLSYLGIDLRKAVKKLLEPFGGKQSYSNSCGAAMEDNTTKFYESIGVKVYQGMVLQKHLRLWQEETIIRKIGTCGKPFAGCQNCHRKS